MKKSVKLAKKKGSSQKTLKTPKKQSIKKPEAPAANLQTPVQPEAAVNSPLSTESIDQATAIPVPPPEKALIYIIGESPMVEEYAQLCASKGYLVQIQWNDPPVPMPTFSSTSITISNKIPENTSVALELSNLDKNAKRKNIEKINSILASTAPIISSSITVTATEQSTWITQKHRLVGIAALPSFSETLLVEVAPTIYTPKETLEAVSRFFLTLSKNIEIVQDRVGMVFPRILCQIINEAAFAIIEDIASPQEIDMAMKLAAQFPFGPIEWAERIGLQQTVAVINALYGDLQEERYRVAPILKQMALSTNWWNRE